MLGPMNETLQITVNGKARVVTTTSTAAQLVDALDLAGRRIAVEVNGEILPRSLFAGHQFSDGDRIEIIHAVGGG